MKKVQANRTRGLRMLVAGLVLGALVQSSLAAPYVILRNGTRKEGSSIRARANGDVILNTEAGQITYSKNQYIRAVADRPPEYGQALQAAQQEDYDKAVDLLEQVVREYRNLEWDLRAQAAIAEVHMRQEEYMKAVSTFEKLFREAEDRKDGDTQWTYYEALLNAEQFTKLKRELDDIIEDGARDQAARAQVMRGDINRKQGDLEGAAMDYLRTVILFKSQSGAQPEALFKAGKTLQDMRDPRAQKMYQTLLQNYGNSSWAERARAEM